MSFENIVRFLEPLIDVSLCRIISLRQLRENLEDIILELFETKKPILLRINLATLLLCDAQGYWELERKRQCVLSGCTSIEQALRTRKIRLPDSQFLELRALKGKIAQLERQLRDTERTRKETRRELADLDKRSKDIEASLRAKGEPRKGISGPS